MKYTKAFFLIAGVVLSCFVINAQNSAFYSQLLLPDEKMEFTGDSDLLPAPVSLTTEMLEHTDRVFLDGYLSSMQLSELSTAVERYQVAEIRNPNPHFGWVVQSQMPGTVQTAYQIMLASTRLKLQNNEPDIWDSGKVQSDNSVSIRYPGEAFSPAKVYYWKVRIWDNHGLESPFSEIKSFITADGMDGKTSFYPLQITDEYAVKILKGENYSFIDFGKAAFGKLKVTLTSESGNDTAIIHLGEASQNGRINRRPGATIRYDKYVLPLAAGTHTYALKIRPDTKNTARKANESLVDPVFMPAYTGEVFPFRYCEIENYSGTISTGDVVRQTVHYPFNDRAAAFHSSDTVLNQVWELCKHSIRATSFAGTYVDGDRERIAYEADALINQLSHYAVDREFSIARYTHEYLLKNPTWPTEWNLQSLLIAWNDYMYTGNDASLIRSYEVLKAKTLMALKEDNGLITTRNGRMNEAFFRSIHFRGKSLRDIVDWPQSGTTGTEKENPGEADGFVFTSFNAVVNAYHYEALKIMSRIAGVIGNSADQKFYAAESEKVKRQFNRLFLDAGRGCYRDGIDTLHASLHASMFPLAFGMVPPKYMKPVTEFIKSRGMACSVYGSQFLLDALYDAHEAEYALQLLTSVSERSWYNMIRSGSTITMEAWDNKYKPNQDWNHAWGAAPANIITRKLFGIEPLEAGFRKIRIQPQPADLHHATLTFPSVRGEVEVSFVNEQGHFFSMQTVTPANTETEIWLPLVDKKYHLEVNGKVQKGKVTGQFVKVMAGSGKYTFLIRKK